MGVFPKQYFPECVLWVLYEFIHMSKSTYNCSIDVYIFFLNAMTQNCTVLLERSQLPFVCGLFALILEWQYLSSMAGYNLYLCVSLFPQYFVPRLVSVLISFRSCYSKCPMRLLFRLCFLKCRHLVLVKYNAFLLHLGRESFQSFLKSFHVMPEPYGSHASGRYQNAFLRSALHAPV